MSFILAEVVKKVVSLVHSLHTVISILLVLFVLSSTAQNNVSLSHNSMSGMLM